MRTHPKEYGTDGYSIHLEAPTTEPYKLLFEELVGSPVERDDHYAFSTVHKTRDASWYDVGVLGRTEDAFHLSAYYGYEDLPKPPRRAAKLTSAVASMEESNLEFEVGVHASFFYKLGMDRSLIKLPIELFQQHPSVPFDTIEGVEVVRSPDNPGEPRFWMDISAHPNDRGLTHTVHIEMKRILRKGYELLFLKMARDFSQEFLITPN